MLLTRSYRNNMGYQIDVGRRHPLSAQQLQRANKNHFHFDGYNTHIKRDQMSQNGLQYGGGKKNYHLGKGSNCCQSGKGLNAVAIAKTAKMLYSGAKIANKLYASETGNQIRNTYGKFMNNNPNFRPGYAGERHLLDSRGITYNFCGQLGLLFIFKSISKS